MKTKFRTSLAALALSGGLLLAGAGVSALPAGAAPPQQAQAQPRATVDPTQATGTVTGTLPGGNTSLVGETLNGTFTLTRFVVENGQLVAEGLFTGTLTQAGQDPIQLVDEPVSAVVDGATSSDGACKIVDLDLGPLHLDVLGLVVDLNEINLDLTAVAGQGNLLGNLLCSVTGILDRGTGLNGLANLLNNLLRL